MGRMILLNIYFVWIMVNLVNVEAVKNVSHEDFTVGYKEIGLKKGHLACLCGNLEQIREKNLDIETAEELFQEVTNDKEFLKKINNYKEVKEFADCVRCNLTYINCTNKVLCIKKAMKFSLEWNMNHTAATVSSNALPILNSTAAKNNVSSNASSIINSTADGKNVSSNALPIMNSTTAKQYISSKTLPILNSTAQKNNESISSGLTITPSSDEKKYKGNNSTITEEVPASYVPKVIDIPIGGHKDHRRLPRYVGCSYPSAMETAALSCRIYPSSITCIQRCAFGHTLENGIQKKMQCKFGENRWIPSGFKECIPFVDCTVTLSSGGSATCTTASVEKAPVCRIECLHYEDKPQVSMALYRCKIDGTWEPPLPFCVIKGSGLVLAPPPKVKLHTEK